MKKNKKEPLNNLTRILMLIVGIIVIISMVLQTSFPTVSDGRSKQAEIAKQK